MYIEQRLDKLRDLFDFRSRVLRDSKTRGRSPFARPDRKQTLKLKAKIAIDTSRQQTGRRFRV